MILFKVRCLDSSDSEGELVEDKIYNVIKEVGVFYYLENDPSNDGWYKWRFEVLRRSCELLRAVVDNDEVVEAPIEQPAARDHAPAPMPVPAFDFAAYNSTMPGRK